MTERCKGLSGKHEIEVKSYSNGGFFFQCKRCRRVWEQNLMQTIPYGADSWASWEDKMKAQLSRQPSGGFWQPNSPSTRYEGEPLEAEIAAPLVVDFLARGKKLPKEQVSDLRELAQSDPAGFMQQFYRR